MALNRHGLTTRPSRISNSLCWQFEFAPAGVHPCHHLARVPGCDGEVSHCRPPGKGRVMDGLGRAVDVIQNGRCVGAAAT
jgi:hypothetical protein